MEVSALFRLVQDYSRLSKIENPTEEEANKLAAILEWAQFDKELSSLINEADHLIAYELGID